MPENWNSRTVLVTGASGGVGRAIVELFAAAGANVCRCDLVEPHGEALMSSNGERSGGMMLSIRSDVSNVNDCARAVAVATETTGRLDLLINCAGVWTEGPSAEASEDEWTRVIDVNLKGAFFMCRFAIPHLTRVAGSIINISSDAGLAGVAGSAIYAASKGGLNLLTRSLALELAPIGVRVNALCPGDIASPMLDRQAELYGDGDPDSYRKRLLSAYPQKGLARFIQPSEVANFVYYLASASAAPITGACLAIDFGLTAGA